MNRHAFHGLRCAREAQAALHPWLQAVAPLGRGAGVASVGRALFSLGLEVPEEGTSPSSGISRGGGRPTDRRGRRARRRRGSGRGRGCRVGRHPGQARIPAGAVGVCVGGGGDCTSMNEAVRLREVRRRSKPKADFAVLHAGELFTLASAAPSVRIRCWRKDDSRRRLPDAVFDLTIGHGPLCFRGA